MVNNNNKDTFIETLLLERDEFYQELTRLKEIENGALDKAQTTIENQVKDLERKDVLLKQQEEQIAKLSDQVAWLKRKLWRPGSEKYIPQDPAQQKIDFEGLEVLPEEEAAMKEAETEIVSYKRRKPKKKKQAVRLPLPEELRREEEIIEPKDIDDNWMRIGEEVTEILEYKPGEVYVRRIIRPKYVLKKSAKQNKSNNDNSSEVKTALLPILPLPKSNVGASLLAELLTGKYVYHLPFHRQLAIFKQNGILLPASTVNDWFKNTCDLLRALYDKLQELTLESDYIQVDESTIPVINNQKQRAVKAYIWVVRSVMENLVFFHYDKGSRAKKVAVNLLKNYKGAIQTDGYEVYSMYEQKKGVLLLGCWAHARRKFVEALKEDEAGATYALEQIAKIYKVEDMATDQDMTYSERADLRKRLAYPILRAFERWIVNYYPKVLPKGRMGRALSYTYSIFHRLSRYHLDGRYQIDNNLVENTIRPMALGRKNYMFCGNHDSAENAAIMYSLFGTCKANDVNPQEWLTDVLSKIPTYNEDYNLDLADLLPHNWKKAKEKLENTTES